MRFSLTPRNKAVFTRRVWAAAGFLVGAGIAFAACSPTSDQHLNVSAATRIPTVTTPPSITTVPTLPPAAERTGAINATPKSSSAPANISSGTASSSANPGGVDPADAPASAPCSLALSSQTVPINEVCSSQGAPHFETPQAAMTYLANAWNTGNVQQIDYVTDPNGRAELDSMASVMVNLQFKDCTQNPTGDYTCYFMHDIIASTSPTTYPNPMNYPPGEAVFTVAPAETPGWYLTEVIHCG